MTDFKDRERGEEAKFAFDEENAFKIAARRNRLLGEWAAGLMNLTEEETDATRRLSSRPISKKRAMKTSSASCWVTLPLPIAMSVNPTSAPSWKKRRSKRAAS